MPKTTQDITDKNAESEALGLCVYQSHWNDIDTFDARTYHFNFKTSALEFSRLLTRKMLEIKDTKRIEIFFELLTLQYYSE